MKTFHPRTASKAASLALSLLAASLVRVSAADFNWSSTSDGDWSALANWGEAERVPGSDFPTNVDAVTLGTGGFVFPFDGEEAETRTIAIGTGEAFTLGALTFRGGEVGNPQNYEITGPGKLIFDSGSADPATLSLGAIYQASSPTVSPRVHQISANIEVHGALTISIAGQGNARNPIISGSITGNGIDPVKLSIGGGGSLATLVLASTGNDFKGGEVEVRNAAGITINGNSLKGATLRFSGTDSLVDKRVAFSGISSSTTFDFVRMIVEASGYIDVLPSGLGQTLDWQSIEIADGKTLSIRKGTNSIFRISGAGKTLSLGSNSLFVVEQQNGTRGNTVSLENGTVLEGNGTVTTRRNNTGAHRFHVGTGGIADPGLGEGAIGTLTFGSLTDNETNIVFQEGSTLRMQLNGLSAGAEHDQLVVAAGNFTLEETGSGVALSLSVDYRYAATDTLTLINVAGTGEEPGAVFTGTFAGLEEGALVNMGLWGGNPATARISYFGGDGNDIVLTDFSVVPEPGTYALLGLGSLAALLRRRRKIGWRIAPLPGPSAAASVRSDGRGFGV